MGNPIATTKSGGICFAFPDVCLTPAPPSPDIPIPYPNIGQMSDANPVTTTVKAGGNWILTEESIISNTTGDQAGTGKGVISHTVGDKVEFVTFSSSVKAQGKWIVRMFDSTKQNNGNAVGQVLGGEPTILVGG